MSVDAAIEVRLLGPVELSVSGAPVYVGSRHVRTLLAVLAMHAGRVVDTALLADALWGDAPPRTAAHALQVHVSSLRKLLGPHGHRLRARPPGYVLVLPPMALDVERFEHAARDGRSLLAGGRPDTAVAVLDDALAAWRGPVLNDVPWERFADAEVRRLEEQRAAARETRVAALVTAGDAAVAVAEADALVAADPWREQRWALLLQACTPPAAKPTRSGASRKRGGSPPTSSASSPVRR